VLVNKSIANNDLFSEASSEVLEQLQSAGKALKLTRGDVLLKQGEAADEIYFIQSGRFKVVVGGNKTVTHLEAGEVAGELAFFAGGQRSADVIATRDANVLQLTRSAYDQIVARYPELPQLLLKLVANRLVQTTQRVQTDQQHTPRVIALLSIGGLTLPPDFIVRLAECMRKVLCGASPVDIASESVVTSVDQYSQWLAEKESQGGYILVACSGSESWMIQASRNADALLLIADPKFGERSISPTEEELSNLFTTGNRRLVLLREFASQEIIHTASWLSGRDLGLHHHLGQDSIEDFSRLARFLCGRANGLVLAGGGALGAAHLGAIKALQDHNIPIDFIGGTSAGAVIAGVIATGQSVDIALNKMEKMFVDAKVLAMKHMTIPLHSLIDPSEFDRHLRGLCGSVDIADLPTPFFAVSTNLSTYSRHIHTQGPLWESVRASASLPAILPPFIDEDRNVLIDGSILDNLPIGIMSSLKQGPNIAIAFDSPNANWLSKADYKQFPSRGALLRNAVSKRKTSTNFPTLIETTQRIIRVISRVSPDDVDIEHNFIITPPMIEGMKILDWHLCAELAEKAESHVSQQIELYPKVFDCFRVGKTAHSFRRSICY